MTIKDIKYLIREQESEKVEFKEAKYQFDTERLTRYCVALANEGGGVLVLGVSDGKLKTVLGTSAFQNINDIKSKLLSRVHLRIEIEEQYYNNKRVILFYVPSRPIGMPIHYKGSYWMRRGEDLVPMTPDLLQKIFAESNPDFSQEICSTASFDELSSEAIEEFRNMWVRKSKNYSLNSISRLQLLEDAELTIDGNITYAALILFGTSKALGKYLPQAEVIFEYRHLDSSNSAQQRVEFREAFFLIYEQIWNIINLRNEVYQYQSGLVRYDIPAFNESVIREAVLNAVSHRDYRLGGSVFIRQYPKKIEIESPGGFPCGITEKNILYKQHPRNRRISEALSKCGLVERSGQGANLMFEESIKESKLPPDFEGTDDYQVVVGLHGEVKDPLFLRFFEKIGRQTYSRFTTDDFLILDLIHTERKIPQQLKKRINKLKELGVIEKVGSRYILSKKFYHFAGNKGTYTRKQGLDKDTNKELLYKHIVNFKKTGSKLEELRQVLPELTMYQIQALLKELKSEGRIKVSGRTRAARWYPTSHSN